MNGIPRRARGRLLRAAAAVATLVSALVGTAAVAQPAGAASYAVPASVIADDAAWILQGQRPDGAIAWYIDNQRISPYLANYAAIGLAEATRVTGDRRYADAAWSWLVWYAGHEDANGFVTNYTVDAAGIENSTGDEDSTDAYAGTFLAAVRAVFRVEPDVGRLAALHAGIQGAVRAILATQDADGLTFAKPGWPVKYLMDQAEAYRGLVSAAELGLVLGDGVLVWRALSAAARLAVGVGSLWNSATMSYDWAVDAAGQRTVTNWAQLYPDAMEQAWLASTTAISPNRARILVDQLGATESQWSQPTAGAQIDGAPGTVGYWPQAGWALLRLGRWDAAQAAAASIRAAALATGRAWPFTTGVAGQLIVLEAGDPSLILP